MKEIKNINNKLNNDKQPSNIEAEQALLGSILVNNDIIDEISSIVEASIFYDPAHIKIYEVIESLNNKGMIANPITLKIFLKKIICSPKLVEPSILLNLPDSLVSRNKL